MGKPSLPPRKSPVYAPKSPKSPKKGLDERRATTNGMNQVLMPDAEAKSDVVLRQLSLAHMASSQHMGAMTRRSYGMDNRVLAAKGAKRMSDLLEQKESPPRADTGLTSLAQPGSVQFQE